MYKNIHYLKQFKYSYIIAIVLLLAVTACDAFAPLLVQQFLDNHLIPKDLEFNNILFLIGLYSIFVIVSTFGLYFQKVILNNIGTKIIRNIRVKSFTQLQKYGLPFFEQTPVGEIVSRVNNDSEAVGELYSNVIPTIINSTLYVIGIFIAMFILDKNLGLICLLFLPCIIALMLTYQKYGGKCHLLIREALSDINAKLNEFIQGISIIRVFKQEDRMIHKFQEASDNYFKATLKNIKLGAFLLLPAVELICSIGLAGIVYLYGLDSLNTQIKIGVLYVFIMYIERLFSPLNSIFSSLSQYQEARASLNKVHALMEDKRLMPGLESVEKDTEISEGKIDFKNVSFTYNGSDKVLKNISFTVNPGEKIAFVGHTGSGKSTIINLLMRFYSVSQGEVLIDNHNINHITEQDLRSKVSMVLQDPYMLYGTVRYNIGLTKTPSQKEIETVSEIAQLNKFINNLDNGLDQLLVENGANISVGQKQLISFARALYKKPKILILDEATANVDTETEEIITNASYLMSKNQTMVIIAHRLSTIQYVDRIYVLNRGEIIEYGNHTELMNNKGHYYKMFTTQNTIQTIEEFNQ